MRSALTIIAASQPAKAMPARLARRKCLIRLGKRSKGTDTAGCLEPDMFSAAVEFWTRITHASVASDSEELGHLAYGEIGTGS